MTKLVKWKKINESVVFANRWINIIKKDIKTHNGEIINYYTIRGGHVVCALGITDDNKIVLIKQYRPSIENYTIDIPGGGSNIGEKMIDAIKREFEEETGYMLKSPKLLTEFYFDSGRSETKSSVYLGRAVNLNAQNLDKNENIKVILHSIKKVKRLIESNTLIEPSLKIAFLHLLLLNKKNVDK